MFSLLFLNYFVLLLSEAKKITTLSQQYEHLYIITFMLSTTGIESLLHSP